jgi:hypothetical protein
MKHAKPASAPAPKAAGYFLFFKLLWYRSIKGCAKKPFFHIFKMKNDHFLLFKAQKCDPPLIDCTPFNRHRPIFKFFYHLSSADATVFVGTSAAEVHTAFVGVA